MEPNIYETPWSSTFLHFSLPGRRLLILLLIDVPQCRFLDFPIREPPESAAISPFPTVLMKNLPSFSKKLKPCLYRRLQLIQVGKMRMRRLEPLFPCQNVGPISHSVERNLLNSPKLFIFPGDSATVTAGNGNLSRDASIVSSSIDPQISWKPK